MRGHDLQQSVAVRCCPGDRLGADVTAGAGAILDDELLAEAIRQPLTHQARLDVGGPAGGKADDDAHRPRRIGLRPRHAGHGRQRGCARGQLQKCAAGKFHDAPSHSCATSRNCNPSGRLREKATPVL